MTIRLYTIIPYDLVYSIYCVNEHINVSFRILLLFYKDNRLFCVIELFHRVNFKKYPKLFLHYISKCQPTMNLFLSLCNVLLCNHLIDCGGKCFEK